MLTKGTRLLNAVKKIYKTITGKDSKSNDVTTVVEGIANNYTGEGGTTVVANPTLAGTETTLTGLEVDGTKYAVPQGGSGGNSLHCFKFMLSDDDTGLQTECTMYLPFEKPDDFNVDYEEPLNLGTKTFFTNLYNIANDDEYPRFPINDNTYFGMYLFEKISNTFIISTYFTDAENTSHSIQFTFNVSNGEVVSLNGVKVDNTPSTTVYVYLYQFF